MLKKLLYLFIGLVFSASFSRAQITNYNFSASTGGAAAYTAITGGTPIVTQYNATNDNDDGFANALPIGFTFNFNGTNYTTFNVCANGFMTFGGPLISASNWVNNITSHATVTRPIIAPYWDDLNINGGLSYVLTGVAPLRVLTVQWKDADQYGGGIVLNFQVKLYETSNIIEFVYQQTGAGTVTGDGASIGITATATGSGNFLSLNNVGTAPVPSSTVETTNLLRPATGQIYRWDPKYCTAQANNITFEKISNVSLNTINNASTSTAQYENFTTVSTTLQPSTAYPVTVTIGGGFSTDQVVVFIDYNQNGVFTDAGETVYTSPQGIGPHTGNFTVPATATLGLTRMRVRMHDVSGTIPNATSCGASTWGQVEDYTINIQNCTAATGSVTPATQTVCTGSATFTSSAVGTGLTQQWQVSTDNGATWTALTNTAPYSGVTTATLTINPVAAGLNNNQYRVSLGGTCTAANTFTNAGTLKTLAVAPTILPAAPVVCLGNPPQALNVTAPGSPGAPVNATFASTTPLNLPIPENVAGVNHTIAVSGIPVGAIINSVSVTVNITHTWVSDVMLNVKAPNGSVLNLSNLVTGTNRSGANFTNTVFSSTSAAALNSAPAPNTGTFKPDGNVGATGAFGVAAGPTGYLPTVATFAGLTSTPNGNWTIAMYDAGPPDVGSLINWTVTINYTPVVAQPVIWSPTTNLFTDANGTIPYTGTSLATVYYKPTAAGNFTYSASYTAAPCTSSPTTIPIVVNTPVSITSQPANAAACTVQGTAVFSVTATGTAPITYQWQVDNGTGFANIANGGSYSGATLPTLTLTNIPIGWNGFKYRCVVSGVAPCGSVNTNGAATLTVNPLPTITLNASPYRNLFPGLVTTITATSVPAAATNGHTWSWSGGAVATTGNTLTGIDVDRMGDYSVRVVDINGCISTSGTISILDSFNSKVFIYPSPNKGQFQVRYFSIKGNQLARSLTVFDAKGSKVYSALIPINRPYGKMDVDLRNIGTGVYTVELSDANGKRINTGRVVVNR